MDMKETPKWEELESKLTKGVAHFTFLKSNGEMREAYGTTKPEIVPKYDSNKVNALFEEARDFLVGFNTDTLIVGDGEKLAKSLQPFTPKESKARTKSDAIVTYYDLESQGWRSCNKEKIIALY